MPVESAAPARLFRRLAEGEMTVLQRDEPGLERAKQQDRSGHGDREPERDVHPDRRRELDLDECREQHDDGAEDEDNKDRRTVAGILGRDIEATYGAVRHDGQQAVEDLAAPATR